LITSENSLQQSRFLRACRREPGDTPLWFMRQAGRYMAEYRRLRERHGMLELCRTPELACEVTLQPLRRFDLDAGIIFSDILLPLEPMGVPFEFARGEGPVIHRPLRTPEDVAQVRVIDPEESLGYVLDAIRLVVRELGDRTPLIGFCGAPFTLASYAIEGGGSRNYIHAKRMMYEQPKQWHELLARFSEVLGRHLQAQVRAGVTCVQMFDSWVGALSPADYREFALPHSRRVLQMAAETGVPVIHFGTGTGTMLELLKEAGGDVIGLDWRIELDEGWRRLGSDVGVQGNLDPVTLMAPAPLLKERVTDILRRAGGRPGHIFNLGHGILPETPLESIDTVIDAVRGWKP